ncbi:plasmid pRiA4b ORF-3 family protein [Solihabitans fulvus]|uniref:Plasmid pRiA4b ORF-3 family protein n=1 Tax=Solihabitans fulvus TaxID=1892852 RepID=A0A5B2XNU8_9PSEU|nr:plasmid pRiA4b ORF-3 family protein [Solihabitans fulvus]
MTAKGVLRRADVPLAGRALDITVPQRVRSAGDVPELHYPWTAALAIGLLAISRDQAVPGPALSQWRSLTGDDVLDSWSRALAAVLADVFPDDGDGAESLEIGRLVLTALATDPAPTGADLLTVINQTIISSDYALYRTFNRGIGVRDAAEVAVELLAAFGAATGKSGRWRVTPLGRWVLPVLGARGTALLGSPEAQGEIVGSCQLKITLRHVRPPCWRRVLVPASATLGDLHEIIQIVFVWDDDHLHGFTVGRRQYGDPYFDAEYDEGTITLGEVFDRGRRSISYLYDFGASWLHDVALERVVEPDPTTSYPVCVDGRGDAPVEDWCEDDDAPAWTPFDRADINTQLARLVDGTRECAAQLRDDIEVILTDADGEAAEVTAFVTVLEEEIPFPVPATLLGAPVIVTGLEEDDATFDLRARCRGKGADGLVSFADLEFRPGTVDAWLHAAYLAHLGRQFQSVTRPGGWAGLDRWKS